MRKIFLPFLFVCFVFPFLAQAEPVNDETLDKIMELSGLNEQVGLEPEIAKDTISEIPQTRQKRGKQLLVLYEEAVDEALKPDIILDEIHKEIRANISQEQALSVLVWLESDLGRKFTQKEIEVCKNRNGEEIFFQMNELLADQDNIAFARLMNNILEITDLYAELTEVQLIPIMYMTEILSSPQAAIDATKIKHDLKYHPMTTRSFSRQIATMTLAYTYKDMAQEDKEKYMAFLITEEAQKLYDAVTAAILRSSIPMNEEVADIFLEKVRAHPDFLNDEEL